MRNAAKLLLLAIGLFAMALVGCRDRDKAVQARAQSMSDDDLIGIAKDYIAEKHPDWLGAFKLRAFVVDRGEYWLVSFVLPAEKIGGVPEIRIDKATKQVISARHSQ